jgi:glycyl-tRNA synthetase
MLNSGWYNFFIFTFEFLGVSMSQPLDFQSIILTLDHYWAEHGCLIWHPYYQQVGAGTYNPATFLRVLGPEPWNVAYLEPSIRPDDGRYGDNPNRLQQFYQYQVILKPDPGNPQELYLDSLNALGIDPREHDIRFVEDNWQSPALGAWGLGWEVWCDGQEITQYTYFQQSGGFALNPISVELTYGLERIAMTLQGVRSFQAIRWNKDRTDGDVNLQGEKEHSAYYYDVADVGRVQQMYSLYEGEANLALEKGLVLPAHDYILKLSHTFNILDARGAVGVTERQAMFGKMRDLSHRVAETYLAQREAMGYPWLEKKKSDKDELKAIKTTKKSKTDPVNHPTEFLFEIGTEELPVDDLDRALEQLRSKVPSWLDEIRLEHGEVKVVGTPRRLVVMMDKMAARQADREVVVKGPPANRAFDAQGKLTPAGEGFAKSKGIPPAELKAKEMDGGTYAIAVVKEAGKSAMELLSEGLPGIIAGIKFDKSMRWNESQVVFSRPIRWLLALLGEELVHFEYAGLTTGKTTRGLRAIEPVLMEVNSIDEYLKVLKSQGILLDQADRQTSIEKQVEKLLKNSEAEIVEDKDLAHQNANLVEAPTALMGNFEKEFLKLPADVLVSVMKHHQKYFPVFNSNAGAEHSIQEHFIAIRNGDGKYIEIVRDGNEQVITARFADAKFFLEHDIQHKLEDFLPRLDTLTFQKKLGTMLAKSKRIEKFVEVTMNFVELTDEQKKETRRAAHLCKADLATRMVVEMTSLQGIMGEYYARKGGEPKGVATAIREHYLPRFAGDELPKTDVGRIVGIADKLDSLAGLFAAGMAPTAAKDPFALRRSALGLVQVLIGWERDFDLESGLDFAIKELPIPLSAENRAACLEFIRGRLQSYLLDQGNKYDVVAAVLAAQSRNPYGTAKAVKELTAWTEKSDWKTILPAYARCVRITRDQKQEFPVDEAFLKEPAEKALFKAVEKARTVKRQSGSVDDLLKAFVPMIPEINAFFEKVLVMDKDLDFQHNRLGLLQKISRLADGVADFGLLEGF